MNLPQDVELPKGIKLRDFNDHAALRQNIFDSVKGSMEKVFPMSYGGVRMELEDLHYDNDDDYDVGVQKDALLYDRYLTKKLRGTFKLYDENTNKMLDKKNLSIMKVPWLTDRGTFIHGGNEYASIMQSRLLPGVYTRRQANGHLETQFNLRPGTGNGFRVGFEPDTAQYRLKISQANLHLYSLLHDLGVPDDILEKRWGSDVFEVNRNKYDSRVFDKAYERLVANRDRKPEATKEEKVLAIQAALDKARVHANVVGKNLPGMQSVKLAEEQRAKWAGVEALQKQARAALDAIPFEPDLTPDEILAEMWDQLLEKESAIKSPLKVLLQAKEHSDKGEYDRKARLMLLLMQARPEEFVIDSDDPNYPGITHTPSGFKIHVPKRIIPASVRSAEPTISELGQDPIERQKLADAIGLKKAPFPEEKVLALQGPKGYEGGIGIRPNARSYWGSKLRSRGMSDEIPEVTWFNVNEAHRGKGYGRKLLEQILADREDAILASDNTGERTTPQALHLYKSLGFQPLIEEKNSTLWRRQKTNTEKQASVLYHGSPEDLDVLDPQTKGLFLATTPGLASLFAKKLGQTPEFKKHIRGGSYNTNYDEWSLPDDQLQQPLSNIHIRHNIKGLPLLKGKSKGYVYKVDASKLKDKLKPFEHNSNDPREWVYSGEPLAYSEKTPHEFSWEASYNEETEKRHGPAKIDWQQIDQDTATDSNKQASYVKGIPDRNDLGDIDKLKVGQLLDFIVQEHNAKRKGLHYDYRVGSPEMGLFSWAGKDKFENLDRPLGLFQQPIHDYGYKDFEGDIPEGYGAGQVRKSYENKVLVSRVSPNAISFSTGGKYPSRFAMVRPKEGTQWLLVKGKTPETIQAQKAHYKDLSKQNIEEVLRNLAPGSVVQPKIDGALALLQMEGDRPEILSHRLSRKTGKPIFHTERFYGEVPKLYNLPHDLRDIVAKGELYGVRQDHAIPAQELGGILNSSLERSLSDQRERGIKLRAMLFDVARAGGKDLSGVPYSDRYALLQRLIKYLPADRFELPDQATDPEMALKMYKQISEGKHPYTEEGLVIHPPTGVPQKIKLFNEHDVHVRGTFPGEGRLAEMGAPGGFEYSLEPDGPIVGRVGTGFNDDLRKQLGDYVGRVAKIRSQKQLPSGAYYAPAFHSFHEDY
jgi:GNAT superfamily N-acetyltransferase